MSTEQPLKSTTVRWYYRAEREIWEGKGLNLLHAVPSLVGGGVYVSLVWPVRLTLIELEGVDLDWGSIGTISKGLIPAACPFRLINAKPGARIMGDLYHSDSERPIHGVLTKRGPV